MCPLLVRRHVGSSHLAPSLLRFPLRSEASVDVEEHEELASLWSEAGDDEKIEGPGAEAKVELVASKFEGS